MIILKCPCAACKLIKRSIEYIQTGDYVAASIYNFLALNAVDAKRRLPELAFNEMYDFDYIDAGIQRSLGNINGGVK